MIDYNILIPPSREDSWFLHNFYIKGKKGKIRINKIGNVNIHFNYNIVIDNTKEIPIKRRDFFIVYSVEMTNENKRELALLFDIYSSSPNERSLSITNAVLNFNNKVSSICKIEAIPLWLKGVNFINYERGIAGIKITVLGKNVGMVEDKIKEKIKVNRIDIVDIS